jgi:hypothetical protein
MVDVHLGVYELLHVEQQTSRHLTMLLLFLAVVFLCAEAVIGDSRVSE